MVWHIFMASNEIKNQLLAALPPNVFNALRLCGGLESSRKTVITGARPLRLRCVGRPRVERWEQCFFESVAR